MSFAITADHMNRVRCAVLVLLPASMLAQQPVQFGAASFSAPAGWASESQPNLLRFTRIQGQDRCMILVSGEESAQGSLDAAFGRVWGAAFTSAVYRNPARPASSEQTSPSGDRYAVGESELEDRNGNRFLVRLHVFSLGSTIQSFVVIGSSRSALEGCRPDWTALLGSLRFRSSPANAKATTGPGSTGARAPSAQPSPSPPAAPNELADGKPLVFDNVTYVPPAGWAIRRSAALVEMGPTNTRGDEALRVLLLPGRRTSAPLANEFDAAWAEVRSLFGGEQMLTVNRVPYDLQQPTRTLRGTEYVRGQGGLRRRDGNYNVDLVVFHPGDRVERVAVISRDFRNNLLMTTSWNNPLYYRAVREFVFSLEFANEPKRSMAPAGLRAGGIVGVWAGLGMSFGEIKTNFAVFFDNGLAYYGAHFPVRGLLDIDPSLEQPAQLREWGTYTMNGDAGTLTMPYGTIPLRRTATGLEVTSNRQLHKFVRLSMPDAPLDGTWCMPEGQCLRLTAEGRFEDNGAIRAVEHPSYPVTLSPAGGRGRYTLRSHTLILSYDSGVEMRLAFVGLPPDRRAPSPSEIRLGFEPDMLVRKFFLVRRGAPAGAPRRTKKNGRSARTRGPCPNLYGPGAWHTVVYHDKPLRRRDRRLRARSIDQRRGTVKNLRFKIESAARERGARGARCSCATNGVCRDERLCAHHPRDLGESDLVRRLGGRGLHNVVGRHSGGFRVGHPPGRRRRLLVLGAGYHQNRAGEEKGSTHESRSYR